MQSNGSHEDGKKLELVVLQYLIISKSGQEELERMRWGERWIVPPSKVEDGAGLPAMGGDCPEDSETEKWAAKTSEDSKLRAEMWEDNVETPSCLRIKADS